MDKPRKIQNLALVGFMGTGKSSVGQIVAEHLHFRFVDTDELIEARAGRNIAEIFAQAGEEVFRGIERQVVLELAKMRRTATGSKACAPSPYTVSVGKETRPPARSSRAALAIVAASAR